MSMSARRLQLTVTGIAPEGYYGSITVLDTVDDESGHEYGIACEPRMAHDIEAALKAGEPVTIEAEAWQIVYG